MAFCLNCGGGGHSAEVCPSTDVSGMCLLCRSDSHSSAECDLMKVKKGTMSLEPFEREILVTVWRRFASVEIPRQRSGSATSESSEEFDAENNEEDICVKRELVPEVVSSVQDPLRSQDVPRHVLLLKSKSLGSKEERALKREGIQEKERREIENEMRSIERMPGNIRLELRGINIPWPYSRWILSGKKCIEARRYPLKRWKNEELWIIETPGSKDKRMPLDTRPERAQIIGTIVFDQDRLYRNFSEYQQDSHLHMIPLDSKPKKLSRKRKPNEIHTEAQLSYIGVGWHNKEQYAWNIHQVRPLRFPVHAPLVKSIVSSKLCERCVIFAQEAPFHHHKSLHQHSSLPTLNMNTTPRPPPPLTPPRFTAPSPRSSLVISPAVTTTVYTL